MLAIYCLDRFRVEFDGVALNTSIGGKSLTVLKCMTASGRMLASYDVLAERLWPDCNFEVARNRLRVAVHGLRRMLDPLKRMPDLVLSQGGSYMLNPRGSVWVDSDCFEKAWQRGVKCERAGDLLSAWHAFEEAESLYVRDYLEEDLYEDWTLLRRECLRDAYLALVERLAEWSLAEGDFDSCLVRCHKLLSRDPSHEGAYRMLMLSYKRLGQHMRALQWFQICESVLKRELGTGPSPETLATYAELRKAANFNLSLISR
jgi:DNA-binding SARP family transcriptional activator